MALEQGTGEKDSAEREQQQSQIGPDGIDAFRVRRTAGGCETICPDAFGKKRRASDLFRCERDFFRRDLAVSAR